MAQQYISDKIVWQNASETKQTGVAWGADGYVLEDSTHWLLGSGNVWRLVTGGLATFVTQTLSGTGELNAFISGSLTITGQTLHNEIIGLSGHVFTYYVLKSETGQFASSGNIYSTGSNLYNLITGLSGWLPPAISNILTGAGTNNFVAKWIGGSGLSNSQIFDNKNTVLITGDLAAKSGFVTGLEVHDRLTVTSLSGFLDRQDIQIQRINQRGTTFVEMFGLNGFGTSIRFSSYNPLYPEASGLLGDESFNLYVDEFASFLQV